ncbi:MAG: oligosaccharide flippase family protein [Microgenomates group bacterium]
MSTNKPRRGFASALMHHAIGLVRNPDIQIIRDLMYLAFGQFTAKVAGFILFAYLARVLTAHDYGALETMSAIVAFAALVVDFGLGAAAVRHRAMGGVDADAPITIVPALRLILAVPCILGAWIAVVLVTSDPVVRSLGAVLAMSLVFHALRQEWLMQSLEKMRVVAFGQFLRVAILMSLAVWFIKGPADLLWFGVAEVIACATVATLYLILQLRAGYPFGFSLKRPVADVLMRKALPLGMNGAIWGLVQNLPTLIIGAFAGLEQAAYLAVAQRLTTSLQSVSYIYHFNMFAALSRRYRDGVEHLQKLSLASLRLVGWASIGPAAICAVYGQQILTLVFGPNFATAGPVLSIAIFLVPVQLLSGHHRWALTAAGETKSVLTAGLVGATLSAVVSLSLVGPLGAIAGALAILSAGLGVWAVTYLACKKHGLPLPILARLWKPSLCAIVAILPALVLTHVPLFAELFLSATIYAILGLIVDKQSIYKDLRHFAYAKHDRLS